MQPETSQHQADRLLEEDRVERAERRLEAFLHERLRLIYEAAKRDAAPIVKALVELDSLRPRALPLLCGGCRQPIGFDPILGSRCACAGHNGKPIADAEGLTALGRAWLSNPAPPYSRADQVRNALSAAFAGDSDLVRARVETVAREASDASLELLGRSLKT